MRHLLKSLQVVTLAALAAFFTPAKADIYAGVGADVLHEKGRPAGVLRADPYSFFVWGGNYAVAASYIVGERFQAGLGIAYVADHERRIGTHENALIILRYCDGVCVSLYHFSHGAWAGYKDDRANGGLNMLVWEIGL